MPDSPDAAGHACDGSGNHGPGVGTSRIVVLKAGKLRFGVLGWCTRLLGARLPKTPNQSRKGSRNSADDRPYGDVRPLGHLFAEEVGPVRRNVDIFEISKWSPDRSLALNISADHVFQLSYRRHNDCQSVWSRRFRSDLLNPLLVGVHTYHFATVSFLENDAKILSA